MSHRKFTPLAAILMLLSAPNIGLPCGDCILPSGGLKPIHPQSIPLAMAARRELDSGLLEKVDTERFGSMWTRLSQRDFLPSGFQLLVIEDGSLHTVGAVSNCEARNQPVRMVTCRAVLQALADHRIHLETAVGRGLIVIESRPDNAAIAQYVSGQKDETTTSSPEDNAPQK